MSDKKLTDSEIVKALECCAEPVGINCCKCPLEKDCLEVNMCELALDLITRLQAENEKNDRAFENLIEVARLWKEKYNNAKKELFDKTEQLKTAKAEAYKEFAERLKSRFLNKNEVINNTIDNLLKELAGEDK